MRLTPKQKKEIQRRRQHIRELALVPAEGVSDQYLNYTKGQLDLLDNESSEFIALVHEYGVERAARAARQYYGRWKECRKFLEAERQRNEALRWANGGKLPVGM